MHTLTSVAAPASSKNTSLCRPNGDGMYRKETTENGFTKHSRQCQATFVRRDWNCHRCVELLLEEAPRGGWQHEYFAKKLQVQRLLEFE